MSGSMAVRRPASKSDHSVIPGYTEKAREMAAMMKLKQRLSIDAAVRGAALLGELVAASEGAGVMAAVADAAVDEEVSMNTWGA
jgi:hypothetical protein